MDPEKWVVAQLALGVVARTLMLTLGGRPTHTDDGLGATAEVNADLEATEELG